MGNSNSNLNPKLQGLLSSAKLTDENDVVISKSIGNDKQSEPEDKQDGLVESRQVGPGEVNQLGNNDEWNASDSQQERDDEPEQLMYIDTHCHLEIAVCNAMHMQRMGGPQSWDELSDRFRLFYKAIGWTREKWIRINPTCRTDEEYLHAPYR